MSGGVQPPRVMPGLGSLPYAAGIVTRQTSAENPSGEKGSGCRWDPDPGDPFLAHSGPAMEDSGGAGRCAPTFRSALARRSCSRTWPARARSTRSSSRAISRKLRSLVLRCYWDEETAPSVEVPIGDFFAIGHDQEPHDVISLPVVVGPARGCSAYWPMPFRRNARVTLTNEGPIDAQVVAYRVLYQRHALADNVAYFHAQWRSTRTGPERPEHTIVDGVVGRGVYVGTAISWTALSPGWWGEGEVKFYLDGDGPDPTIVDNGTEDYFGGAWGFGRDAPIRGRKDGGVERAFSAPYLGCPLIGKPGAAVRRFSLYRWHLADPIGFDHDLRVTVQALGWNERGLYSIRQDIVASVGYWYQHEPHVRFPALPAVTSRRGL